VNPHDDIYAEVARRIRELRSSFGGKGISQTELAQAVNTTANTVSRWESGGIKPTLGNVAALARFFGVPISRMFPDPGLPKPLAALLSAAEGLDEADLEEMTRYALFKRAITTSPRSRSGRK
jgi:transcriptional regulator with XRE-family HTH domain